MPIDGEGANDNGVSVAARVVLAHCDDPSEGCFSVDEPIPDGSDHFDGNWSGTTEGVPFDRARWGTIRAYFPNGTGTGAHSHQADRFCVGEYAGHWIPGSETTHEYGHLVHYWEWDVSASTTASAWTATVTASATS